MNLSWGQESLIMRKITNGIELVGRECESDVPVVPSPGGEGRGEGGFRCGFVVIRGALSSSGVVRVALVLGLLIALAMPARASAQQQRFNSSDEALTALVAAAKARDTNAMHAIFGPAGQQLISADAVQATAEYEMFLQRLTNKVELTRESDSKMDLRLGQDGWTFPIPLVRDGGRWFFDTVAGEQEILNRRIGMNEIGAIQVCRAYVTAQREYATKDRNNNGVLEYAQFLRSTPGTHDGLYWPAQADEELSPLGPLIAQARVEGYRRQNRILADPQSPYHGYFFKVLTRQGKHAPGGKHDYIINGHMIAGFGLVAWPAEWGNSGIMTLIVSQQGVIHQKNLGPKTASLAAKMTSYDPDNSWSVVEQD